MKRKTSRLRLSPNEEARIIREEQERRRKLRLQQVREQQRCIALQIRREVEQKRQQELQLLEDELRLDWEQQQREKLLTLHNLYQESLQLLGEGHRRAKENEPDLAAIAQQEEENHSKAEQRYREALKELKSQKLRDHERQNQSINARKKALQAEKERSAKVASLPPPPPNPLQIINTKKPHIVHRSDINAFATTHYHMPESAVDREMDVQQPSAMEVAEAEEKRQQDVQREERRRREEQLEKARLRGRQALRREQLVQDRERLLVELEHMQQTDLLRRRQQVTQMPAQIFQPLYKRQEVREDFQREMEFAFEDMYTGERRVKGDLVVRLVPEPLPAASPGSQDQELDVTLDDVNTPETDNTQDDAEQERRNTEQEASVEAAAPPSRPPPRQALRRLLDRIRNQRNQIGDPSHHVPAAGSPSSASDQIPERDSTIETGSLLSDGHKANSDELHASASVVHSKHVDPAEEMLPPASIDSHDLLAARIREHEEERRRKEEELEREKQQQVAMLRELEEQKAKLEQMLLEAEREREHLKAAVTNRPEEEEEEAEEISVSSQLPTEQLRPADEDEHTRRIKEYQQRLLEQNRVHQRSVEVARRRLEEYQRALQIRHGMTAASLPPSGHAQSHLVAPSRLPAEPQENPRTSADEPVKLVSASPPHPHQLPSGRLETVSHSLGNQRPDLTAFLTHGVMERVTEHLPQRLRPTSLTAEPTAGPSVQPTPCSLHDFNHGAPLIPVNQHFVSTLRGEPTPRGEPLSSRKAILELQEARRLVLEQQRRQEELQRLEAQRLEAQRLEAQRLEAQRLEAQRLEAQQLEAQRLEAQRLDAQRLEAQRLEAKRLEAQRLEAQRLEAQRLEAKRLEAQRLEAQRLEAQRLEAQRLEAQRLEAQRLEAQRLEAQRLEAQRLALQQKEDLMEQQRQQEEEERWRQELQRERMRRQKETLQALINTDAQSVPESHREAPVLDSLGQNRLRLLSSLLRAIEESHGGTLSHLEASRETESSAALMHRDAASVAQSDAPLPGPSPLISAPSSRLTPAPGPLRLSSGLVPPAGPPSETSVLPSGPAPPAGPSPLTSVLVPPAEPPPLMLVLPPRAPKPPMTRVRLDFLEMMTQQHELSAIQEVETPANSSQAAGPDGSLRVSSHGAEVQDGSDAATLSDTRLQTCCLYSRGQQAEQSSEPCADLTWRDGPPTGARTSPGASDRDSVQRIVSPPSSESPASVATVTSCRSFRESPVRPADSDFHSSSLSTGSYVTTSPEQVVCLGRSQSADRSPAASSLSAHSVCEAESPAADPAATGVESVFSDGSIQRIIDRYTKELDFSLSAAGRTSDGEGSFDSAQSSVGASESRREDGSSSEASTAQRREPDGDVSGRLSGDDLSPAEDPDQEDQEDQDQDSFHPLVGRPADQSSCLAADQRDSSWEQLVVQPSAQSSVIGPPPGPDPHGAGWDSTLSHMMGRLSCPSGGGRDLLAARAWLDDTPDESRMRPLVGELDESTEQLSGSTGERSLVTLVLPSQPPSAPEPPTHSRSDSGNLVDQGNMAELHADRSEVFPGSDSFHPLWAEVTHNETAEPSITFHPPDRSDSAEESEPSPERLRSDEASGSGTTPPCSQGSFGRLHDSLNPTQRQESLDVIDVSPRSGFSERLGDLTDLKQPAADSQHMLEAVGEKGILEQSEITLVSLTDTTLQEEEEEEEELLQYHQEEEEEEELVQYHQEEDYQQEEDREQTEESLPEGSSRSPAVEVLECPFRPSGDLQEAQQKKLSALLHRSRRRVEAIKAKGAHCKTQPEEKAPSEAPSDSARESRSRPERGRAERAAVVQEEPQLPPGGGQAKDRKVEVKTCTAEQRKRELSAMRQRTQRLYEQLEEVKHQRAVRSRQEDYAKNRLKAREFHKKTLQKLRAKQTRR